MRGGMRVPYHARAPQQREQRSRFGHCVACPFIANGIQVHCPGILGTRRASDMHWKVAFYDGDTWFVRRDRLFTVVDLAAA